MLCAVCALRDEHLSKMEIAVDALFFDGLVAERFTEQVAVADSQFRELFAEFRGVFGVRRFAEQLFQLVEGRLDVALLGAA